MRQSGVSFATRVSGLALAFLANILLSRMLGPSGYGTYAIAIGWASVLAIPARLGLDNAALRFATTYRERRDVGALRGLLRTSAISTAIASVVVGLLVITGGLLSGRDEVDPWLAVGVAALVYPFAAMGWLSAVVRSFGRIFASQAYEQLFRPALLILLLGFAWLAGFRIGVPLAVGLTVVAVALPLAVLAAQVRSAVVSLGPAMSDVSQRGTWLAVSWPLLLLSLFQEASNQIDLILLGILNDATNAAHFAVALRLSSLASFGLVAIASVSAPRIASAHGRGDYVELAQLARINARISLLLAIAVIVPLFLLGPQALAAFGPTFPAAYPVLAILLVGAMLNAFTGNVANFMLMTGHQGAAATIMAVGLAASAVLDILMIPKFGAVGAAVGSVVGLVAWNSIMLIYVRRNMGIDASALGLRPRSPCK